MHNIESPFGGNSGVHLIRTFSTDTLIADWRSTFEIDVSNYFIGISEIYLYHCVKSTLDFFVPPDIGGSEDLYEKLGRFNWFYMNDKWEFDKALSDLSGSRDILEVGCGPGFFMEKVQEALRGANIRGIEFNRTAAARALELGLNVESVTLSELGQRHEKFDAICVFQVLEHLSAPRKFFAEIMKILRPGGKLIVSVPNRDSFLKYQYNLLDLPPHHMTRWNVETLRRLPRYMPISTKRICFEPLAQYHIDGFVMSYGQHWQMHIPFGNKILTDSLLRKVRDKLNRSGMYRYFRGQSIYALFERL